MGNNITIADVAETLGVSKTTVSRAISGKGRISEATRQRVLNYIDEHDYKPNVIARGWLNLRRLIYVWLCQAIMLWWICRFSGSNRRNTGDCGHE